MRRPFRERSIGRHLLGLVLFVAWIAVLTPIWFAVEHVSLIRSAVVVGWVWAGLPGSYRASEWLGDWFARNDTVARIGSEPSPPAGLDP